MTSSQKSFLFAAIMCLVCGFLLTAAAQGLKPLQLENIKIDKQKNILKALGAIKSDQKIDKATIKQLYESNIVEKWVDNEGRLFSQKMQDKITHPIYLIQKNTLIDGYAFPFKAYGLWSWIHGYVAFDRDGDTLRGFTVYQHGETPGLGGECEKPWFQNQFKGKKITNNQNEFVSIGIVKGKVADKIKPENQQNYVDGMSGATITSKGLEDHLKTEIEKYEPFSKKMRGR